MLISINFCIYLAFSSALLMTVADLVFFARGTGVHLVAREEAGLIVSFIRYCSRVIRCSVFWNLNFRRCFLSNSGCCSMQPWFSSSQLFCSSTQSSAHALIWLYLQVRILYVYVHIRISWLLLVVLGLLYNSAIYCLLSEES